MRRSVPAGASLVALLAVLLAVTSWGGVAPWQWNDDDVDCASDRFDARQWRRDATSLAGQIERRGILTRSQWQARVFIKCVPVAGKSADDLRAILGEPHADDGDWTFALGNRVGAFRSGAEDLHIRFGTEGRAKYAAISRLKSSS